MTKELILERQKSAELRVEELIAEVNLFKGVIADCTYWLNKLEEEETKVASNGKTTKKLTKA